MTLKVHGRVTINDSEGNPIAKGIIININEYREPSLMYAVEVEGYNGYVLVGKNNLMKTYQWRMNCDGQFKRVYY